MSKISSTKCFSDQNSYLLLLHRKGVQSFHSPGVGNGKSHLRIEDIEVFSPMNTLFWQNSNNKQLGTFPSPSVR